MLKNSASVYSRLSKIVRTTRSIHVALWFVFLLASALIIAAARGDLWLDEIWSLSFARTSHSITDVFVRFHHDNNHLLNTVFLYYAKAYKAFFVYRLLAVLSGIGSVFLVGYIARKEWGDQEALCSLALAGTSYPLLLYFSEARGYASAIFFALASYALLRQNMRQLRPGTLVLFWSTSILGMLSHSTFIMATMAFCVESLAHEIHVVGSFPRKLLRFVVQHASPLIFFACLYMFFLRDMEIGGGPIYSKWDVIAQASALLIGFPELSGFLGAAIVCVLVLITVGVISLRQEGGTQWLFFLTILYLSPIVVFILTRPQYLYFRYFIICFPFFYLLLSHLACKYYRSLGNRWRWLLVAAVAMLIAGQAQRVYALLAVGRGNYFTALAHIAANSPKGIVRVGSDHDFRNRVLFDFYAPLVPEGDRLRYVEQPTWREAPPDWLLIHSQDVAYRPPKGFLVEGIGVYRLTDAYRFSGISGWSWFVFRREALGSGRGEQDTAAAG